ncbi:Uncharacterised protein [Salmonella enterica]|nr:Uncharacterised protein [Salmonella enterica]
MNEFHTLNICLHNKDRNGAMRILRDKSEFAVRKILEKIKVRASSQTGRPFWLWVQNWINSTCKYENIQSEPAYVESQDKSSAHVSGCTESRSSGCSEAGRSDGHVCGSRQYSVSDKTRSSPVCRRADGLSAVHTHMGDERTTYTRTSSEKSKQVMALGVYHSASIQSGFPPSRAVVCAEHSVRFRGCDTASCPEVQVWEKRYNQWCTSSGFNGVAITTGKLRPGGNYAGCRAGISVLRADLPDIQDRYYHITAVTLQPEWYFTYTEPASRHPSVCHTPDTILTHDNSITGCQSLFRQMLAIYAPSFFLLCLCRPSFGRCYPGLVTNIML